MSGSSSWSKGRVEDRKQALIKEVLRQKAEAMKGFDDQLAKLG
jgi:hypothetical protein